MPRQPFKSGSGKSNTQITGERGEYTPVESHIATIIEEMTANKWVAGPSHQRLATLWDLSITYVERLAAEASRAIRRATRGEDDIIRAQLLADLSRNSELGARPDARGHRDIKASNQAIELTAKMCGLFAPTKTSIELSRDLSSLSDDELRLKRIEIAKRFLAEEGVPAKLTSGE